MVSGTWRARKSKPPNGGFLFSERASGRRTLKKFLEGAVPAPPMKRPPAFISFISVKETKQRKAAPVKQPCFSSKLNPWILPPKRQPCLAALQPPVFVHSFNLKKNYVLGFNRD